MELNDFHLARPVWLWAATAIPVLWLLIFLFYCKERSTHHLEKYIDRHLLPYLLLNGAKTKRFPWKAVLLWSTVWACLTFALSGPRWNLREIETFSQDQTLVILLDLSDSMNATDIKPSRLVRAKQKIEDLLNLSNGVKIGLIAFAADPHMIVPITDDKQTIRHLLPSVDTSLVYVQGSRLSSALDMTSAMLSAEPGNNKAVLIISDGGFEDASAITTAKKMAEKGVVLHTMGIGTKEGVFINNSPYPSKLEMERLSQISQLGNGHYLEAHYTKQEESLILNELRKRAETEVNIGKKNQFWDEGFYLMIFPILPIFLWWFRKGHLFAIPFLIFVPNFDIKAVEFAPYFMNTEQITKQSFDEGNYQAAADAFEDPYRKGVAYYKASDFAKAEKMFRQSTRSEVAANAAYNLGNALVYQDKLQEAITTYEAMLKTWPDHIKAQENLALVKQMLEQQQKNKSDQQENQKDNQSKEENQNSQDSKNNEQSSDNTENSGKEQEPQNDGSKERNENEQPSEPEQKTDDPHEKNENKHNSKEQEHTLNQEQKSQMEDSTEIEKTGSDSKENQIAMTTKSQEDLDADLWLTQIDNDPQLFLKNKFFIESKKSGTKEGIDPW